jgi:phospholipase C
MPSLPDTSNYMSMADNQCATQPKPTVPATPGPVDAQESGIRFARALPYELHVNGSANASKNTFAITFGNTGEQGAHFYVYAPNRTDGPWRYTVEAGKSLSETFDLTSTNGVYSFEVFGPNGFVRKFAGNTAALTQHSHGGGLLGGLLGGILNKPAQPEVTVQYDVANGNVFLKFTNSGGGIARLNVIDNAYGTFARPVLVPAGLPIEEVWVLASSHHWYDLTVKSSDDASFSRRIAGHVENGRPSITDPAAVAPVLVVS